MTFQAAMRAAAVALLTDYAASTTPPIRLQVYPGRPRSIHPPTAFVDSLRESLTVRGIELHERRPFADVLVIHGLFDSLEAVTQRDAFVDGFVEWVFARVHAAGANTTIAAAEVTDAPAYVPDWLPPEQQRTYYATTITLEGYAES